MFFQSVDGRSYIHTLASEIKEGTQTGFGLTVDGSTYVLTHLVVTLKKSGMYCSRNGNPSDSVAFKNQCIISSSYCFCHSVRNSVRTSTAGTCFLC